MFKRIALFISCLSSAFVSGEEVNLSKYEKSLFSSHGEDGVLAKIFQLIPASSRTCVELGAGDGMNGSMTYILKRQGWKCLLIDRAYDRPEIGLHKDFITAENINLILEAYQFPHDSDLFVVDIGYNNFHIWRALHADYRPKVVVIGFNSQHAPNEDKVVKYRPLYCGDASNYFSASILAFDQLAKSKGYSLIYAEQTGSNLFFVRDDCLDAKNFTFSNSDSIEKIYTNSLSKRASGNGSTPDPKNRPYLTAKSLLESGEEK